MTRETITKKRSRALRFLPLCALLLAALLLALDGRRLQIALDGPAEMTLARGTAYEEPGCRAALSGRLFGEGRDLPVTVEGEVDADCIGVYERSYTARWLFWEARALRRVEVTDQTPPVITLYSREGYRANWFEGYDEEGFAAEDDCDGDLTAFVERTEDGDYVTYTVSDAAGNITAVTREIPYDVGCPRITLEGGGELELTAAMSFTDPCFSAQDRFGHDLTDRVQIEGEVDPDCPSDYALVYRIENAAGDAVSVTRQVHVRAAELPETIMPEEPTIYLSFDDGPGPYTAQLLDLLAEYDVKATFFVTCRDPDALDMVGRAYREGHSIGVHSATHDYEAVYADEAAYYADFLACEEMIFEQTGGYTTLFRFPGGSSNTVSCFNDGIMTRLTQNMTAMGYQYFDWNVDSDDAGKTRWTGGVLKNILEGCEGERCCVVLQHDVRGYSVAAVRQVIEWGLENGYRFAPLDMSSPPMHHPIAN